VAPPLIKTEGLVKDYRLGTHVVHALRQVWVEIEVGEFVAVMGPSGSGKSTFMNLLGCLDTLTAGRYILDEDDVSHLSQEALARVRNRKIGFVFQGFNLLPRVNALENVELPLLYSGAAASGRRRKAREKLEIVGLADRQHHHPAQLSGGQQQRVAIARALINDPVLILADEPTGNLDSRTSVEIMAVFQEVKRNRITSRLLTTQGGAGTYAGRRLVFRDGRLRSDEHVTPLDAAETLKSLPEEEEAVA